MDIPDSAGPEIRQIIGLLQGRNLSDADIIALFEQAPPPPQHRDSWFRSLSGFCSGNGKTIAAAWFTGQLQGSPTEAAVPEIRASVSNPENIFLVSLESELRTDALEPLLLEAARMATGAESCGQPMEDETCIRLKAALRSCIHLWFRGVRPAGDFNLVCVFPAPVGAPDAAGSPAQWDALHVLLDGGGQAAWDPFRSETTFFLWSVGTDLHFFSAETHSTRKATPGILAAASVGPHFGFASDPDFFARYAGNLGNPGNLSPLPGSGNSAPVGPEPPPDRHGGIGPLPAVDSESILEGNAIAEFPIYLRLMTEVFGLNDFGNPHVRQLASAVSRGGRDFRRTAGNSPEAYQALINLYCLTNGYSNDFLAWLIRLHSPPFRFPEPTGTLLGRLDAPTKAASVSDLRERGYHVFSGRLPEAACDSLMAFALGTECSLISESQRTTLTGIYDRAHPKAFKYNVPEEALLALREVQALVSNPSILGITQDYLGSKPILAQVAMWWNTSFGKTPSSAAAQLYHFDMDRVKWLKWFIYLTDVTTDTGPHCLIAKSHHRGRKPAELLQHGYARLSDEQVHCRYPAGDRIEVLGPRGTIIAVDTRAFHKGKLPSVRDRLILEFEFCNSMFGGEFDPDQRFPVSSDARLLEMAARFPHLYHRYLR